MGDMTVKDPYQFYNNRYLEKHEEPLKVHTAGQPTGRSWREKGRLKLFPFVGKKGSDGIHTLSEDDKVGESLEHGTVSNSNNGYLPAQLSVQDLLPDKQDDKRQLATTGDVVIVTARDSSVLGEMKLNLAAQCNPYNRLNQKFHAALWCPLCIFLFFPFCIPAVLIMRESDKAFANQDFKKAKKHGTISTFLYFTGILFALVFYAFAIFFAVHLTREYGEYKQYIDE